MIIRAATRKAKITNANNTTTRCAFLKLPGELRNFIYSYVLMPDDDDEEYNDGEDKLVKRTKLEDASPPSKALALTCREVYSEYIDLCREAYPKFFAGRTFYTQLHRLCWCGAGSDCQGYNCVPDVHTLANCLQPFRNKDTEHITALDLDTSGHCLELRRDAGTGERKLGINSLRKIWSERVSRRMFDRRRLHREEITRLKDLQLRFYDVFDLWHAGSRICGLTKIELDKLMQGWKGGWDGNEWLGTGRWRY